MGTQTSFCALHQVPLSVHASLAFPVPAPVRINRQSPVTVAVVAAIAASGAICGLASALPGCASARAASTTNSMGRASTRPSPPPPGTLVAHPERSANITMDVGRNNMRHKDKQLGRCRLEEPRRPARIALQPTACDLSAFRCHATTASTALMRTFVREYPLRIL